MKKKEKSSLELERELFERYPRLISCKDDFENYPDEVSGTDARGVERFVEVDYTGACEAFVETFLEVALDLVPVDTGYLYSTISADTDGYFCWAEATAEYAQYVEYGTWCM